jgi:Xaa-Pro aminopeptidase
MISLLLLALAAATPAQEPAQGETSTNPSLPHILPLRERADVRNAWLRERFDTVLPDLMRRNGVDMWILVAREYLEDPVVSTMLDAENLRARRRTILVFVDRGPGKPLERLVVSKHGMNGLFDAAWDMDRQPDQWAALRDLVAKRDPKRIAINTSSLLAFGDGLTKTQHDEMLAAIGPRYRARTVSGQSLAVNWLETRTPSEMQRYPDIVRIAHSIIGEGFSSRVVTPGLTTNRDLVWWYRQRVSDLGLASWFQPSVEITRRGTKGVVREEDAVIRKGDMLRVDFGIVYLDLNTDTQHVAYVLRDGEKDAPAGLKAGLADANGVQDALTSSFRTGDTGNQVLARAIEKAKAAGLRPTIYTHPIGYHGHAAGPAIGLSEEQKFVSHGELPVNANTGWSIELKATRSVPEWGGQEVDFKTEEDAFFDGREVRYIDGRQTRFHLIGAEYGN